MMGSRRAMLLTQHCILLLSLLCIVSTAPMRAPVLEEPQAPHDEAVIPIPHEPKAETHMDSGSKPRMGLLHMHDAVWFFARLGSLTLENKKRYAARWGYDMISAIPGKTTGVVRSVSCKNGGSGCFEPDPAFDIDHGRAPTFGKIKLALAACVSRPDYWLLWSDADAMVVNQSVPLESIIDDSYDLIFAYDWLMLNAGMLLMKCTPWTTSFLTRVYEARKFDKARALDQSALQEHLDNLAASERNTHVKVIPKYAMNVYLEEYRPGDFLLHMAGKLYEATEEGLWAIARQFDSLSRIDDVRDIAAFFDTRYLLNAYSGTCDRRHGPNECKPEDTRRLQLNETLGSMSTPKRYRHVSLRYYFLPKWEDKYDVAGWDVKKKAIPYPVDKGARSEPQIVAAELAELERKRVAPPPAPGKGTSRDEDGDKDEPVSLDAVRQALAQNGHPSKSDGKKDDDDDGDDDDEEAGSGVGFGVKMLVGMLFLGGVGSGLLLYRKRRRAIKVQ